MTAFYSFRMVFRVFFGDKVPENEQALEKTGHPVHAEPENPHTGEKEGAPTWLPRRGPPHRRAATGR